MNLKNIKQTQLRYFSNNLSKSCLVEDSHLKEVNCVKILYCYLSI